MAVGAIALIDALKFNHKKYLPNGRWPYSRLHGPLYRAGHTEASENNWKTENSQQGETENNQQGEIDNNSDLTDEEKIQSIINDAEEFANNNDFDKAINKIEEGLVTYPNSIELQNKLEKSPLF